MVKDNDEPDNLFIIVAHFVLISFCPLHETKILNQATIVVNIYLNYHLFYNTANIPKNYQEFFVLDIL